MPNNVNSEFDKVDKSGLAPEIAPPRRERLRGTFQRRSGIISTAEIEANVKASGVQDDNDKTGVMGIRDTSALRKNADSLRKGK
jgi:hypothetical protein